MWQCTFIVNLIEHISLKLVLSLIWLNVSYLILKAILCNQVKLMILSNLRRYVPMYMHNLHLSRSYLQEIIEIACLMNPSGKRKYSKDDLLRVLCK